MTQRRAVVTLAILAAAVVLVAAFAFLPKTYRIGERLGTTTVFWNDQEAFLMVNVTSEGRATNVVQDELAGTRYGLAIALLLSAGADGLRIKPGAVAYHLFSSGALERFDLPEGTGVYGSWALRDGALQFTPSASNRARLGDAGLPLRWEGGKFVALPAASTGAAATGAAVANSAQSSLDDADSSAERSQEAEDLKNAGWHRRMLVRNKSEVAEAVLPIKLGQNTFNLTQQSFPPSKDLAAFNLLSVGAKELTLAGGPLAKSKTLWQQNGWKEVSKSDFGRLPSLTQSRHRTTKYPWLWPVIFVALVIWRLAQLFGVATMKRSTINGMPTAFSLPPATPEQFPFLDSDKLERCTREFESLGFTRLLDYSLVGDKTGNSHNFCRALVHTGHHCFAVIYQFFPAGQAPRPMKCDIQGDLQEGWEIQFCDSKPRAEASLLQSGKSIIINHPGASMSELLQEFLKLRGQVCTDLSIAPERDDTLDGYIRKKQRGADRMRASVRQKSFALGLAQVLLGRFSLLNTRKEYVWLGDYPKEAERRKKGYVMADTF
jgi:hypothetical protein